MNLNVILLNKNAHENQIIYNNNTYFDIVGGDAGIQYLSLLLLPIMRWPIYILKKAFSSFVYNVRYYVCVCMNNIRLCCDLNVQNGSSGGEKK